ncbi:MAG: S41 family peptidase [Myxococcota bacterium]|nr:S41 family peptidase [Myxococcota bacterium]
MIRTIMRNWMTYTVVTGMLLSALPALAVTPSKDESPLVCWTLPSLMARYFENHVKYRDKSTDTKKRVVDLYADSFDPGKSLLIESEYKALVKRVAALLDDTFKGKCEDFTALHEQQIKWQGEMEAFVRKAMEAPGLKIDRSLALQVDPDKRKRPTNIQERNAIRLKLLHFQLANYVQAGTKLEEAKKRLIHRYELITKRIKEMTKADVYSNFLNAFARSLDPHTSYFSADDLEDFRISMDLSLEGIGAVLSSRDGYTTVQEVVPGGAADRQGQLKTKDKIIAVAQGKEGTPVDVIDMSLRNVVKMIRGKKGTEVRLTVLRQKERTETLNIMITRDKIDLKEQAAKLQWKTLKRGNADFKLAIIQLPSFYGGDRRRGARNCTEDVKRLLVEANQGKADGLLLDLSRNGGGLLKAAVDISGLFIAKGAVVAIDGPATPKQVLKDKDDAVDFNGPMVVLTSRVSASASEILAGALKDYRRAIIAGDSHTFGKGTVQNIVQLPPKFGALKVTTAHFFRPGGQSTQSQGVDADIVVPSPFDNDDYGEKHQPYALPSLTVDAFRSTAVNTDDPNQRWRPITADEISDLGKKSKARIKTVEAFSKIVEDLGKRKKNKGVIKIAELLDEKKDEDKDEDKDEKKPKKLSPQAVEALDILADLIARRRAT